MMIFDAIVSFFVDVIFEGILHKFWNFLGSILNRINKFLFKKKK